MPTKTKASEYRNNAATAERSEYQNEETESKAEYPSEDRDNSYLAANQHMVKFTDELRSINEQAALDFDLRKNPAEYDQKEKQEMLEAVTEAFNAAKWNSANERLDAAHQVSQNLYQPMYSRIEVAEAAAQHRLPAGFIDEVRKEKIDYLREEAGRGDRGREAGVNGKGPRNRAADGGREQWDVLLGLHPEPGPLPIPVRQRPVQQRHSRERKTADGGLPRQRGALL